MRVSTLAFALASSLTLLLAGAVDAAVSSSSSSSSTTTTSPPHGSVDSIHGASPSRATSPPSRLRGAATAGKTEAAKAPGVVPPSPQCLDAHGAPLTTHLREGHLYAHVTTMPFESWHEANQAAGDLTCCHAKGRLLVVNDAPEREFVQSVVVGTEAGSAGAWMAIVDDANDGVWASAERPTHEAGDADASLVMGADVDGCDEGADSYDDKDYRYGVRCRPTISRPLLLEFECPRGP